MEASVVTAMAAAMGSLIGAGSSIATTWMVERTRNVRASAEWKLRELESLYKEFAAEASRLAVYALTHEPERPEEIVTLYGILSQIRLVSGEQVVREGEACCLRIIELYLQPPMTKDQVHAAVAANDLAQLDPIKTFSNACRNELLVVEHQLHHRK
jgi:hypothetical protein